MLAPSVPPVTAIVAVTPLLVFMATVRPESVLKLDLMVPELSSTLAVLPVSPLSVISIKLEPSVLSVVIN